MIIALLAWIVAFMISITVHEFAHAWTADKLGDPTPRMLGRLSLNPLVHYDRVGTTLLLGLTIIRALGAPVIPFGWAKPVPFDPYNLKNPRKDAAVISVAGPISNFVLAILVAVLIIILGPSLLLISFGVPLISLNIVLGIFNLIPVHPLDGGKIFVGLLPKNEAEDADQFLKRYGFAILLLMIFPFGGQSAISYIITPILDFTLSLLIPSLGYM